MASLVVLFVLLVAVTITDVARHHISNKVTYPGMIAGIVLNGAERGWTGVEDSVAGFLACGGMMLICFVLFSDVGGGDVKLIAMIAAFLGLERGMEAMLWTFILGGVMGTSILIWKFGILSILSKTLHHLRLVLRAKSWIPLTEEERAPLQRWLFLAPSALAAVCVVLADHRWGLFG